MWLFVNNHSCFGYIQITTLNNKIHLAPHKERPSVNIAWGLCKTKKSNIPKLCQNIGLGKLFLAK